MNFNWPPSLRCPLSLCRPTLTSFPLDLWMQLCMVYHCFLGFLLHHQPFHPSPLISAPQSWCRSSTAKSFSPRALFPPHTCIPHCLTHTWLLTFSPIFPVKLIHSFSFIQNCNLWFCTCRYLPLLVCHCEYLTSVSIQARIKSSVPLRTDITMSHCCLPILLYCHFPHMLLNARAPLDGSLCLVLVQLQFDHFLSLLHTQSSQCFFHSDKLFDHKKILKYIFLSVQEKAFLNLFTCFHTDCITGTL